MGAFSGESSAQKRARKTAAQAPGTLQTAQQQFLEDPIFLLQRALAEKTLEAPETLTPEIIAAIKANLRGTARQGARADLEGLAGAAGRQDLFRSGGTRRGELEIGSRLGESLATIERDVDIRAAMQKLQDTIAAINLGTSVTGQQFQFPRDIANALLGTGSIQANLAGQPTPAQQTFGGIGQLAGNVLSAAGAGPTGSISGLFK